jgi:hypothetical protein
MQFQRFDPTGCDFPQSKVPVLPALSRQTLGHAKAANLKPLGTNANAQTFTRGRYALTEAYRLAGVGPNSSLLAPAYHCRTMLDPAIRLGGSIALYPLTADLSPDLPAMAACLAASPKPVKAMLLTHYFGFAQNLQPIAEFCAQHDIMLIEDCSHALFTHNSVASANSSHLVMGQTGRYGVASPYKFFASEDGGVLWANDPNEPPLTSQTPQALKQELKGIIHAMQKARIQAIDCRVVPPRNDDTLARHCQRSAAIHAPPPPAAHDKLEQSNTTSPYYQPEQEHLQSLACSRWVMRHTHLQRLTDHRRQNYQHWSNAVAGLPHCHALFPALPANCVPYMFPLYIDHPETHFFALKQLGMPIWRWDDMAVSDCAVASSYRLHLLHLPCHQELSAAQMTWMTTTLQNVMQQPAIGQKS